MVARAHEPLSADTDTASVLRGEQSHAKVTAHISGLVLNPPSGWYWAASFALAALVALIFFAATGYLFYKGVGVWGIRIPVAWGYAIANYVWWIGIGMGGTFISSALLLLRQDWRSGINRAAESMTLFAVAVSGMFPIMHLGRPWFFYWLAPYPNTMNIWPQWRSALLWDFFAIVAYLTFSLLFWYVSLLPDVATLRDRAQRRFAQGFYGLLALGWRGEARQWRRHKTLSLLLAGLGVPIVFSVHSMVGLDFSQGNTPGWHSTIFPPFFVAGALYSGFALVLALVIPMRAVFGLYDYVTPRHLDNMAKVLLAVGLIVTYSYGMEIFTAWYSASEYEIHVATARLVGVYAAVYWTMLACNCLIPQALWLKRVRLSVPALFTIAVLVVIGMWLERFILVITSLYQDFLPSAWGVFIPSVWDWVHLFGSMGVFAAMFLLFLRLLPAVAMFEMRELVHKYNGASR